MSETHVSRQRNRTSPTERLGVENDPERLRQEAESAHERALNYLSYRPRSHRELESYLLSKGYKPQTIAAVRVRLETAGLLDDHQFAVFWVTNRLRFSPRAKNALRHELRQKGIDSEIVDTVLDATCSDVESAVDAGRGRLSSFGSMDREQFRRRMLAFLNRRGFAYQDAREACATLWGEAEHTSEPDA